MNAKTFELRFENDVLHGDTYGGRCETIVLHGAGQSSRARFSRMRERLNANGVPSVCFDFIGHGDTGGSLIGSCLLERSAQAAVVISQMCTEPLTLIGASMGAYTAIKLTEKFSVANLILLVPAVYTPEAYDVPFGPAFSSIIRTPNSWQASDAFRILEEYKGNVLVIAAEDDEVIPIEVVETIHASAKDAKTNHLHIVPASTHLSLFPTLPDFHFALEMVLALCRGGQDNARPHSPSSPSYTAD